MYDKMKINLKLSTYFIILVVIIGMCDGRCKGRFDTVFDSPDSDEPCNGVCIKQHKYDNTYDNYIVVSSDKMSCSECMTSNGTAINFRRTRLSTFICPSCKINEYWCKEEQTCKAFDVPCNENCPSHIYPILNKDQNICQTCDQYYNPSCNQTVPDPDTSEHVCLAWCPEMSKCIDVSLDNGGSETCNGKCFQTYSQIYYEYNYFITMKKKIFYEELWLCTETNKCVASNSFCGSDKKCKEEWDYYCPKNNLCQSKSRACNGTCPPGRRYCPRYKIDDFIGDGKGSCIENKRPCGEECPDGLHFCLATFSCIPNLNDCPCPPGKWPMNNCGNVQSCQLNANETLPLIGRGCSVVVYVDVYGSKSTRRSAGDCHPEYIYCEETMSCTPLLYSSCGYSDWLKAFNLRQCIQNSSLRATKDCLKKVYQIGADSNCFD